MSGFGFDSIERGREFNEGLAYDAYAAGAAPRDETGDFAVRTVFLDGVERIESTHTSLRAALNRADEVEVELRAANYTRRNSLVDVVDQDDPERGSLDWGALDD